jgi:hypothetical protein
MTGVSDGEAAVAEVRWNCLLAPVHPLAITFVLVLLAGAALDTPPEDRLTVRVSGVPAPDADLQVILRRGADR